ncbi:MAG: metallophosphoesterase, partial [Collinsella sp.]|nr:metallophosphoesterase [Collinsella sp.]
TLYVLGDMIDRGPDPVGVIKLVRSLPIAHVLKGNHEQIMLDAIIGQDPLDAETWDINGGWTTREQLNDMKFEAYEELVRWMAALPLYAVVETAERPYLLVHAGIQTEAARAFLLEHGVDCADGVGAVGADRELLQQMLAVQSSDDLLWIRHGYWDVPTGLLSTEGKGPVVVSGHTPTVSLGRYCEVGGLAGLDEESGRGQIVRLGGEDAAGVPDRIDIDCAAATGSEFGRVGILRLDDGAEFYANINPGE